MNKITKENLKINPDNENAFQTKFVVNGQSIEISLDPDDVELEKTINLVNKIIGQFELYESKAKKVIIQEYLESYNDNWRNEEDDEPELDEQAFSENLTLNSITFLSDTSVDFFYSENGMFGNHYLIAQSFDGENFNDTTMYG
ncbi:DUF2262 domain-containing protein [Flavobacterium cerinum]|uniref:DUF2262 domain-containing protein n=1 Tax=Flavobacterium cerinum TaxID=2502784 RepID=A0ABY5ITA9_9FLAO|nr:DUF2262 domain-containing protein [Flavobacterium cerinum]UUC44762.1 DUF2262 domain-containing protein [Flavobacterium cerinum]